MTRAHDSWVTHHIARVGLAHAWDVRLAAALLAGLAYAAVNIGLFCAAMGLAEARSPLAVWQERFH